MTDIRDDPRRLARASGLRYSTDGRPGFTRRRAGRGFTYRDLEGATIRDPEVLARIRSIVIPPAWTEVWICPWPNGHLQATGRDARAESLPLPLPWLDSRGTENFGGWWSLRGPCRASGVVATVTCPPRHYSRQVWLPLCVSSS